MKSFRAIGGMSGTSLDGLDIVLCNFKHQNKWSFSIEKSQTVNYNKKWKTKLSNAPSLTGYDLNILDLEFGGFIAEAINTFLENTETKADVIASHGHTIFHQPEKRLTLQIGNGHEIAVQTGLKTITNFRALDVALGGQGAPLVPVGDELLFSDFDFCLNIGGFANISYSDNSKRFAYDIGPANIILNYLTNKIGHDYDKNGALGVLGNSDPELLNTLNSLEYYSRKPPKSLGREWLEHYFMPILDNSQLLIHDKLRTVYEHIALQISGAFNLKQQSKTLVTGGGAYNKLLIKLIKKNTKSELIIPDKDIVDYKEALIFSLLGILKLEGKANCLSSVTGARKNSSTGNIYSP